MHVVLAVTVVVAVTGTAIADHTCGLVVVGIEVVGVPAHLRTLLRRVHDRLPGVPVITGLWTASGDSTEQPDADGVVATLREAVITCRDLAATAAATDHELLSAFG